MRLEIVFKDGRKEIFDDVACFKKIEVTQTPTEGNLFEVNPLGIDRNNFEEPRSDQQQEKTRQLILEAFAEVDKHPEKYGSAFYTMIPKQNWEDYEEKTVAELKAYAKVWGDRMANWIEQALEWAQRISNGESWEAICNDKDPANSARLIVWKKGYYREVGSWNSAMYKYRTPASYVDDYNIGGNAKYGLNQTVPLVVIKK